MQDGGLQQLVILFRHGRRLPKRGPPGYSAPAADFRYLHQEGLQEYTPIENIEDAAFLTQEGFLDAHASGCEIRRRYNSFLNDIDKSSQIYLRCTDYQRTFYSLQAFYHGMFGIYPVQHIVQKARREDELYSDARWLLSRQRQEHALQSVISVGEVQALNHMLGTRGWSLDDIDDYLQQRDGEHSAVERDVYQVSHRLWVMYWEHYYRTFENEAQKQAVVRPLFGPVAALIIERLSNTGQRLQLLAGHDSTISALLTCLDAEVRAHPAPADYLAFEVRNGIVRVHARLDGTIKYVSFMNGASELPLNAVIGLLNRYAMSKHDADQLANDKMMLQTKYVF